MDLFFDTLNVHNYSLGQILLKLEGNVFSGKNGILLVCFTLDKNTGKDIPVH
jgi:hypothetical protein